MWIRLRLVQARSQNPRFRRLNIKKYQAQASSPEITGPSKKPEIDTTKTAKPEIDNPSRPAVDKTNSKPSEIDTGKPVKLEVSQARPSEVASPNSRPKEVDVTKKPDIEVTRPAEVQSDQD